MSTESEETAAVSEIFEEYSASLLAGDTDRWISLWTEDGVQLPPDAPMVVGRSAMLVDLSNWLVTTTVTIHLINTQEVQVAGDWAYASGTYVASFELKAGGPPVEIDGKFFTIFKQQPDGSWKIHRDIFNSNVP